MTTLITIMLIEMTLALIVIAAVGFKLLFCIGADLLEKVGE